MRRRLRTGIAAIRTRLARVSGYVPIRIPGLALALAALAALWFARREADYLLFPAALAILGLIALCLVFTTLAALALRRSIRRRRAREPYAGLPEQLETTRRLTTGFRFRRLVAWPLVEAKMRWHRPAGIKVELVPAGGWFEEVITAEERGRHPRLVRSFTVEDIFGLTAITFRVTWEQALRIVPARGAAGVEIAIGHATGDAFSHPSGRQEGDLVEMRRYGHGDPMRHVLWKTFARTRRLLVRMPERAIAPSPTTSAFLIAGIGDEAAAATARLYVETGLLGTDFVFAADGAATPTTRPEEAVEQIIDSIAARGDGGGGLEAFRKNVDPVRLGRCVVFAPPSDGAWCERVAAFSRALPSPATVIIGVEGFIDEPKRKLVTRLLLRPAAAAAVTHPPGWRRDLARIRATLEAGGVMVKVLHRDTGQVL
jgi:hypothetical protein